MRSISQAQSDNQHHDLERDQFPAPSSNVLWSQDVAYAVSDVGRMLLPHHLDALSKERGICDEVIAARGLRSISDPRVLIDCGFKPYQTAMVSPETPTILIPIHAPDGTVPYYIHRPDAPRPSRGKKRNSKGSAKGKVIKYETPEGVNLRLDRSPLCAEDLKNPSVPLVITEGPLKGDAGVSHGLCVLALPGVYGFKSRNKYGGKEFSADFDHVPVNNGRKILIIYDNDAWLNPQVRDAEERLAIHLRYKGASVRTVRLPMGDGRKIGLDDYLLTHSIDELEALIDAPSPIVQAAPPLVELLDHAPAELRRPLGLIGGQAYVAIWPYVRTTTTETVDQSGTITRYDKPKVTNQQRLLIVRSDGALFGEGMSEPIEKLGIEVRLPEIPAREKLWSMPAVRAYQQSHRPSAADVFNRIVDVVDRFIDFDRSLADQRTMTELVACYCIATWFLPAFNVIGFLWPTGERGSGKTQLLNIIAEVSYLGHVILAGGSYAGIRDLADYGATLCFDDAENIADPKKTDPDKRALLLAGNRRGNTVPVKELGPDRNWHTRHVNTFCPRLFSAIRLPDPVLASRTIVIPLVRTCERFKANADPLNYALWPHDRRKLIDDLWALSLANLPDLPRYEELVNEKAELMGRNLEPWRPILAVAAWLEERGVKGIWNRLQKLSTGYQQERQELESSDLTALVIRAICRCLAPDSDVLTFSDILTFSSGIQKEFLKTSQITEAAKEIAEEVELGIDPNHINERRIGWILKRLRLDKRRESNSGKRGCQVSRAEMQRWVIAFGLYTSEKTSQLSETSLEKVPGASSAENIEDDAGHIRQSEEIAICDCCGSPVTLVAGRGHCQACGIHLQYSD